MTDACQRARDDMALELYGELEPGERRRLEAHVDSCPRCAEDRERLRAGLGAHVELTDRESTSRANAEPRRSLAPVPLLVAVAAGFLAGVLSMLVYAQEDSPRPGSSTTASLEPATFRRSAAPPRSTSPGRLLSTREWKR